MPYYFLTVFYCMHYKYFNHKPTQFGGYRSSSNIRKRWRKLLFIFRAIVKSRLKINKYIVILERDYRWPFKHSVLLKWLGQSKIIRPWSIVYLIVLICFSKFLEHKKNTMQELISFICNSWSGHSPTICRKCVCVFLLYMQNRYFWNLKKFHRNEGLM